MQRGCFFFALLCFVCTYNEIHTKSITNAFEWALEREAVAAAAFCCMQIKRNNKCFMPGKQRTVKYVRNEFIINANVKRLRQQTPSSANPLTLRVKLTTRRTLARSLTHRKSLIYN